jgi:acetolactate synthase-1/3 small subunit
MKHTLSIFVKNEVGSLARISSLLSGRGLNIQSLIVAETETLGFSKILLETEGNDQEVEQAIKMLQKSVPVIRIQNLTNVPTVERELVLVRLGVRHPERFRADVFDFGAVVVDHAEGGTTQKRMDILTIQLTSSPGKVDAFLSRLKSQEILEITRTGKISVSRYSQRFQPEELEE